MTWLPPYKRNVNTVFQNYALFPHLTIFENVAFGLRRKGVKDAEVKSRVTEMLELVELPGFETRKPNQISGGQAQRVALARALINRPAVLLLDEPLGALDLKLRKQMQVELKRIQQEVGITFIYVTHDQEEAMTMSDRIAVMNQGRYEQLGDPEVLYERPDDALRGGLPRGQQPARRRRSTGSRRLRRGRRWPTTRRSASRRRWSTATPTVEVGVRPEKIRLHEPTDDGAGRAQPADRASSATRPTSASAPSTSSSRAAGPADGLRAERRAGDPGRALGARRGGPADLVARPHVRRPERRRPPRAAGAGAGDDPTA